MGIVNQLLKGAAETKRMREEINEIVILLIDSVIEVEQFSRHEICKLREFEFKHNGGTWVVGRTRDRKICLSFEVDLPEGLCSIYSSELGDEPKMEACHVKRTHDALPRLIEELLTKYPALHYLWASLFRAAA